MFGRVHSLCWNGHRCGVGGEGSPRVLGGSVEGATLPLVPASPLGPGGWGCGRWLGEPSVERRACFTYLSDGPGQPAVTSVHQTGKSLTCFPLSPVIATVEADLFYFLGFLSKIGNRPNAFCSLGISAQMPSFEADLDGWLSHGLPQYVPRSPARL